MFVTYSLPPILPLTAQIWDHSCCLCLLSPLSSVLHTLVLGSGPALMCSQPTKGHIIKNKQTTERLSRQSLNANKFLSYYWDYTCTSCNPLPAGILSTQVFAGGQNHCEVWSSVSLKLPTISDSASLLWCRARETNPEKSYLNKVKAKYLKTTD